MNLRKAEEEDIGLIMDLSVRIWPLTYSSIISQEQIQYMMDLMYSEQALLNQMRNHHDFFIISNENEDVGFASISLIADKIFKLHKIYILPAQQGKGTGRFAIEKILEIINDKGGNSLQLNVNRHNKARQFYERLGFGVIREEDIDIGEGYFMNDYVMEKKI